MEFAVKTEEPVLKLDPRTKFALLFGMGFCAFTLPYFWMEVAVFGLMLVLTLLSRQMKTAFKFSAVFTVMLLMDIFVAPFVSGALLPLFLSIVKMVRLMLPIFLASALLIKTTTVSEFMVAFKKIHLPDKIIIPLSVMFRFIPTISEEWHSIRDAMRFRGIGVSAKSVVTKPMMTLEYVMIPLLMSTAAIADELAAASLSRGLDGGMARTCIADVRLRLQDYILLLLCGAVMVTGMVM